MLPVLIAEAVDYTVPDAAANAATGGILAALAGVWIFLIIVGLLFFIFWLLMLINAIKLDDATFQKIGSGERTLWLIVLGVSFFVGFSWLAAIVYYFVIYRKAKALGNTPAAPAA
jgi:uncharacterized BrkB/YihY/UPF0761 family membrane protein